MNSERQESVREDCIPCRLCGSAAAFQFAQPILAKYPVAYWRCEICHCLQTDLPHWLDEAYATVQMSDTGMVARTWQMAQTTSLLLRLAGVGPDVQCMDWGGGNGLFCRMMRDQGYNFASDDKYAEPFYCRGFTRESFGLVRSDIVTSFEVFEHLADPASELKKILAFDPKLWIFSTQLYKDQDQAWNYLSPNVGRHVFFYSDSGLRKFAGENGFEFWRGRDTHMLIRRTGHRYLQGALQKRIASRLLAGAKPATLAAVVNFISRQRKAYSYWSADSTFVKRISAAKKQPG
jgi:Methyltransferase domain